MTTPTESMLLATMRQIAAGKIKRQRVPRSDRPKRKLMPMAQFAATAVLDVIGRGEKEKER